MIFEKNSIFDDLRDSRWAIPAIGTLAGAGIGASTGWLVGTNKILPGAGIGALFGAAAGLGTQYLLLDHKKNSVMAQRLEALDRQTSNLQDMARATINLSKHPKSTYDAKALRRALEQIAGDRNFYNNNIF